MSLFPFSSSHICVFDVQPTSPVQEDPSQEASFGMYLGTALAALDIANFCLSINAPQEEKGNITQSSYETPKEIASFRTTTIHANKVGFVGGEFYAPVYQTL